MKHFLLTLSVSFAMLMACNSSSETKNFAEVGAQQNNFVLLELNQKQTDILKLNNQFAIELSQKIDSASIKTNWFASPLSASFALAMATNGAAESTQNELKSVLGFSKYSIEEFNEFYNIVLNYLLQADKKTTIGIANSVWTANDLEPKKLFVKNCQQHFNAVVENIDFNKKESVDLINSWCAEKTDNCIEKMYDKLNGDTKMLILNALYFKGEWSTPFNKKSTMTEPFTNQDGSIVKTSMMNLMSAHFNYLESDQFAMAEFPYGNGNFSFVAIVANGSFNIDNIMSNLTATRFDSLINSMSITELNVKMPKFKIEKEFNLNNALMSMGINEAFSTNANFSNIADKELFISEVKQKAFINVDESGTEAAAVTGIGVRVTSLHEPIVKHFYLNKPFAFFIIERNSGAILFTGKINQGEF